VRNQKLSRQPRQETGGTSLTTTRQQLNAAESLLRKGKLSDAVHAYHRAWVDRSLKDHEESPVPSAGLRFPGADFRGFARFREGELLALLGGEREARVALDDAETRGGVLRMLAAAFLANYAGPDGAVRAWAGLPDIRNLGPTNEEPATSNIYGQPPDILYLGQPLASYLTTHPDAAEHPDAVFETMRSWGLETSVATAADLDGDGTNEFLFETPNDGARRLWVVYRKNGRWLVADSFHRRVEFGGIVALPKGNAIKMIYEHTGSSAPESALTWRDGKVMFVRLPSLELSLPGSMQSQMLPWPNCLASLPH